MVSRRRWHVCICVAGLLAGCGGGGDGGGAPPPAPGGPPAAVVGPPAPIPVDESGAPAASTATRLAITNVTVVPMDRESSIPGQTVLVEGGVISAIEDAASAVVPPGAEVIDGTGRFLMPGLIDMHVHLMSDPGAEHDLVVALAAGVTSLRIMWGSQTHLGWRSAVREGSLIGADLFVATAGLDGSPPFWPGTIVVDGEGEARAAVRELHASGYDFIKLYERLQLAPYLAILDEADALGIRAIGHVPRALTAPFAIDSGQFTIEHFSRFAAELTTTGSWSGSLDGSSLAALAERIRLAGTWNCPTLTVQIRSQADVAGLKANPLYALLSRPMREWLDSPQPQPPAQPGSGDELRKQVLAALVEAGTGVLIGTDAGVRYVFPGFSIHEELRHFVDAGLSPFETLRAATADAALALEAPDRGTIAVGRRADLLLLDSDPLEDVGNVNRRVGVMAGGKWFTQSRLMEMARSGNPD
jgi:imidazolonepropionase-like amidohydrolase